MRKNSSVNKIQPQYQVDPLSNGEIKAKADYQKTLYQALNSSLPFTLNKRSQDNEIDAQIFKINNPSLMYTHNIIDGMNYFIDLGSFYTIVPKNKLQKYSDLNQDKLINLTGPSGEPIKVYGTKQHKFDFNNSKIYTTEVIVCDLNEPLLGLSFFKENIFIISPSDNSIIDVTSNHKYPCKTTTSINKIKFQDKENFDI